MICRYFILEPHPAGALQPPAQITGRIFRRTGRLSISLQLLGPLHEISIPARAETPARRRGLWEETCFELFLGPEDSEQYWEFNLSPSGHWNVFRFSAYRSSMQEEPAFASLPFTIQIMGETLLLELEFDMDRILRTDSRLDAGVSAAIRHLGGQTSYWALAHFGPRPDFHKRECFAVKLPCRS
jgi:hypothetical protein